MSIEELEKKPYEEWTTEEILFWLEQYAKEIMMKEIGFEQ